MSSVITPVKLPVSVLNISPTSESFLLYTLLNFITGIGQDQSVGH